MKTTLTKRLTKRSVQGLTVAGLVLAFATGAVALVAQDDEVREVAPIDVAYDATARTVTSTSESESSSDEGAPDDASTRSVVPGAPAVTMDSSPDGLGVVPGLGRAEGLLQIRDDDFYVNGRELDFGPDEWLVATAATADLDGNGTVSSWWSEVSGLIGKRVQVLGDVEDDDIDVYEINGANLRPLYSTVAPWSDEWQGSDVEGQPADKLRSGITAEEASRIALRAVPGVVVSAHVDVNDGHPYWELDVRARDGSRFDIEIDAVSGELIEVDRD